MKETFKEEGPRLMTDGVPWGQQRVCGAGGGCCRESVKLGDDQEAWASSGSGVNRGACHNGSHPAGLLVIGAGLDGPNGEAGQCHGGKGVSW